MMVGIVFESPYGNRASIIAKQKRDNTYNNIQQLDIYTNPQIQADQDKLPSATKPTCSKKL